MKIVFLETWQMWFKTIACFEYDTQGISFILLQWNKASFSTENYALEN